MGLERESGLRGSRQMVDLGRPPEKSVQASLSQPEASPQQDRGLDSLL